MDHAQAHYAIKQGWPGIAFTLTGLDFVGMAWGGPDPRPTEADVLAAWATVEQQWQDEQAAVAAAAEADEQRDDDIRALPEREDMLEKLRNATPQQISDYVDNNVTDLASARTLFKRLIYVLALVVKD
jgi:cobalamin biosynthesis Mg chelatase CobN